MTLERLIKTEEAGLVQMAARLKKQFHVEADTLLGEKLEDRAARRRGTLQVALERKYRQRSMKFQRLTQKLRGEQRLAEIVEQRRIEEAKAAEVAAQKALDDGDAQNQIDAEKTS